MAAASIIAQGTTEAASSSITLADGASATISIRPASTASEFITPLAVVDIQLATSDTGWMNVERLTPAKPAVQILGPGVFRAVRRGNNAAANFGVDQS